MDMILTGWSDLLFSFRTRIIIYLFVGWCFFFSTFSVLVIVTLTEVAFLRAWLSCPFGFFRPFSSLFGDW